MYFCDCFWYPHENEAQTKKIKSRAFSLRGLCLGANETRNVTLNRSQLSWTQILLIEIYNGWRDRQYLILNPSYDTCLHESAENAD